MTRFIALCASRVLKAFSDTKKYPTRTVEYAFAWIMVFWGYSVFAHPEMMVGKSYGPMLDIMPAIVWGGMALAIGITRVVALIFNGGWYPTPEMRLAGAAWGLMFWTMLAYCYYLAVDVNGGTDFPMRRAFFVLIFFEAYSSYRCGQDIGKRDKTEARGKLLDDCHPSRPMDGNDG